MTPTARILTTLFLLLSVADADSQTTDVQLDGNPPASILRPPFTSPPHRFTVKGRTLEGLVGGGHKIRVLVPPAGLFESHVAVLPGGGAMMFTVRAVDRHGIRSVLGKVNIPANAAPAWRRFAIDLSAHAGEQIELSLGAGRGRGVDTTHAFWGAPKVYSLSPEIKATPVVLISCDTVRADHLSVYGYERDTSPNLERLAEDGVVFENAFTPVSWTLRAHLSMLTGLHPVTHRGSIDANLAESVTTLAESLRARGYHTAGFTGFRGWLQQRQGFAQGFDIYETPHEIVRAITVTHANALSWLEDHVAPNIFLFLHNYEAHALLDAGAEPQLLHTNAELYSFTEHVDPTLVSNLAKLGRARSSTRFDAANRGEWTPSQQDIGLNIAFYDDTIRIADAHIGKVLDTLKRLGLYDRALIVVTADHGEAFGEHGRHGHTRIYETDVHIPLIVKFPGARHAGRRVEDPVSLMDIMPTILDVIGGDPPTGLDGQSLVPLLENPNTPFPPRDLFLMRFFWRGLRTFEWKLVDELGRNRPELYHLSDDPLELHDVADANPEIVKEMSASVKKYFASPPHGWHFAIHQPKGADQTASLRISTSRRFNRTWLERPPFWQSKLLDTEAAVRTLEAELKGVTNKTTQLHPEGPDGRIRFILNSEVPWIVLAAGQRYEGKQHALVLLPNENLVAPLADELEGSVDAPTLRVWYVPPKLKTTAPEAMSPEDEAALKALGYLN